MTYHWIAVRDKLPEEDQECFVFGYFSNGDTDFNIATFLDPYNMFDYREDSQFPNYIDYTITHWMPAEIPT